MSDFYVQTEALGPRAKEKEFLKELSEIIQIDSLHNLEDIRTHKTVVRQCFIIQTEKQIRVFTHYKGNRGQWIQITEQDKMQKIKMIRGLNDKFYFIEKDKSSNFDIVYALQMIRPERQQDVWRWKKYPVYELNQGHCIGLEIDPFAAQN